MPIDNRWTIRIDDVAREMVTEVHQTSDECIGALVSLAIREWYENLPEEDDNQ